MSSDSEQNNLDSVLVNKATPEYLQDLLKDKKQLQNFPNIFIHLEIILEKEITRVREKLFHLNESFRKSENELPEPSGSLTTLQEKVFVPVKENPNYNFVGRLLGPRGLTAKQLEQDLECKIMVRGRGSLRDKKKEDMNRGKPNWEHLDEELHVLVSVEDFENRAPIKLRRATETIRTFLEQGVRTPENEDRLKQLQLMELAVLNDKDRQQTHAHQVQQHQQLILQQQSMTVLNNQAAVAAAAAAAQMLQPNTALPASQLLARLQASQTSNVSLGASNVHLNPALASLAGSVSLHSSATGSNSNPLSTATTLTPYLSNSVLPNVLCSLPTNQASGQMGLTLSQLPGSTSAMGISSLPFQVAPGLSSNVSSNLINCNTQDQFTAMAAALLAGNSNTSGSTVQLTNGKVNTQNPGSTKPSASFYPMTSLSSPLLDAVNIIEYNSTVSNTSQDPSSESLKMRTSLSGHNRIHPYLR